MNFLLCVVSTSFDEVKIGETPKAQLTSGVWEIKEMYPGELYPLGGDLFVVARPSKDESNVDIYCVRLSPTNPIIVAQATSTHDADFELLVRPLEGPTKPLLQPKWHRVGDPTY